MSVDWTVEATAAAALRARGVESDLADASLHAHAKAAIQEIAARGLGPETGIVTHLDGWGQRYLTLSPPASAVTAVTEEGIALSAGDDGYRLLTGGTMLERLLDGYAYRWSGRIVVTHDAAAADDRYDRVVTDLVKLALQYSGLDARRDGDYSEEAVGARSGGQRSYQDERELLISELLPPDPVFA